MGQNALGQSDYRIFKSTISLEQNDEKAWFFAYWYRFMENRSWLKNIGVAVVKNECGHSGVRTLKFNSFEQYKKQQQQKWWIAKM